MTCLGFVPETLIECGTDGNYCSIECFSRAETLPELRAATPLDPDATEEIVIPFHESC